MTQHEMFEKCFDRPQNYHELPASEKWNIDERLGILDWDGDLEKDELVRYWNYFKPKTV